MSTIIEQQNELVQSIYKKIQDEKDNLDKMFYGFINKLENTESYIKNDDIETQTINSYIENSRKLLREYDMSHKNLLYWYDMNEKKFINKINLYDSKIIKCHNFKNYSECNLSHYNPLFNCDIEPHNDYNWDYDYDWGYEFIICIDNYLNIILPNFNIIIINNYYPFSNKILYSIIDLLNIQSFRIFNFNNEFENKKYNEIIELIRELNGEISKYNEIQKYCNYKYFIQKYCNYKWWDNILMLINYQDIINYINLLNDTNILDSIKECSTQIKQLSIINLKKPSSPYDDILFKHIKELQLQLEDSKKEISKLKKEKS